MALADAVDIAYAKMYNLQKALTKEVPIMMLTDSLSLFGATSTTEKEPHDR